MRINFRFLAFFAIIFISFSDTYAQQVLEWRGADRSGVYPEKNLLKQWPEGGPALLWENASMGNGYGSPIITDKNIFILGETDTVCYLYSLDLNGKELWKSKVGPEWVLNYPGVRTTPTLVDGLLYVSTGMGIVACFDAATGKEKWSVDMVKEYNGRNVRFGYSESILIDDNKLFFMPGGADTNVVALDSKTGKLLWISKGLGQIPSYCSPMMIKLPQKNILVTFSKNILLGIDAKDGKLLWSQPQDGEDVQANTPVYENGFIYYIAGDGNGAVKLKLSEDGNTITDVWKNKKCDNLMGAFIKVNDYIYTSGYEKRFYYTLDEKTGVITDSVKFDRGTINYADGMLYLYNEKGDLGLFKPAGPKMEKVSSFKVTKGTKAHYAHPVICNGIMYIRHGRSLLAYDIRQK